VSLGGQLATASFWIDLAERTLRTFCQTAGGALLVGSTNIVPIPQLPFLTAVEIGGSAALLTLLTGLGSIAVPGSDPQTASFLPPPSQTPVLLKAMLRRKS
jgi:hypothetical protein